MEIHQDTFPAPKAKTLLFFNNPENVTVCMLPAFFNNRTPFRCLSSSVLCCQFRMSSPPFFHTSPNLFRILHAIVFRSRNIFIAILRVCESTALSKLFRVLEVGAFHVLTHLFLEFLRIIALPFQCLLNKFFSMLKVIIFQVLCVTFHAVRVQYIAFGQMTTLTRTTRKKPFQPFSDSLSACNNHV